MQKYYPQFFEQIPFSIVWIDSTGKIIYSNVFKKKIFGYSTDELIEKNFRETAAFSEQTPGQLENKLQSLLNNSTINESIEFQALTKDNSLIWINVQISILHFLID